MEPESPTVANTLLSWPLTLLSMTICRVKQKVPKLQSTKKVGVDVHDGSFPETLTAPNFIY